MQIAGKEYEKVIQFYKSAAWKKLRAEVLALDHNECQRCKSKGKYSKATVVHHVNHVLDRPDLALTLYVDGQRNLISLCNKCHNEVHPEKRKDFKPFFKPKPPLTEERW